MTPIKTLIVCATRENEQTYKNTLLYSSLEPIVKYNSSFNYKFVCNNTQGLSKVYNEVLLDPSTRATYDVCVFIHDDVYLDDFFFDSKIRDCIAEFDIMGVAGGLNPTLKPPILWHLMCGRENLRGYAGHMADNMYDIWMTSFGATPARVALLDGVFLAVSVNKVLDAGWKFNENYDFHCYDIASCIDANNKKLKCGVIPVNIIHKSPGLRSFDDKCFVRNQAKFLAEYIQP